MDVDDLNNGPNSDNYNHRNMNQLSNINSMTLFPVQNINQSNMDQLNNVGNNSRSNSGNLTNTKSIFIIDLQNGNKNSKN